MFVQGKPAPPAEVPDGLGVWVDSAPTVPPAAASGPLTPKADGGSIAAAGGPVAPLDPEAVKGPEWLKAELARFNKYVAGQLARLETARLQNAEIESRHEAMCVSRTIDLSRQVAALEARREELDRRDAELRQTADAVAAREAEVGRRESALADREATVVAGEARRVEVEAEATELSRLVTELRPAIERLELRKTEAETIRAELAARQTALDRRLIEVGRKELAMQKRMAELDELEQSFREELDEREAELARQRAVLLEEIQSLHSRLPSDSQTPLPRLLASDHSPRPAGTSAG